MTLYPDHHREAFLDKPLPSNEEAERLILAAIILDNAVISQAVGILEPDDFYSPLNRRVFAAMLVLFAKQQVIEPLLIGSELKKEGSLDAIGGVVTITNLTFGVPHFSDVGEYVKIVKDKSTARQLIRLCSSITSHALDDVEPIEATLELAEQSIFALANPATSTVAEHIHVLAVQEITEKARQIREGVQVTGMPTGLKCLDNLMGGYEKKDLIIVGGRPSMGKTSLVTKSIVDGLFATPGAVGIFFSAEMSKKGITGRTICQYADINLYRFNHNHIHQSDWQAMGDAIAPFEGINFYVDDTPGISVVQMLAKARRIQARHGRLDIVGVDHLGLMSSGIKGGLREQITQLTKDLKAFAKTMDVPTIALSQLSRAPEGRSNPMPVMADLRDSGSIEQDADVVLFVYRPDYYNREQGARSPASEPAQIIVAKQRNGPTGTADVRWVSTNTKFIDFDQDPMAGQLLL